LCRTAFGTGWLVFDGPVKRTHRNFGWISTPGYSAFEMHPRSVARTWPEHRDPKIACAFGPDGKGQEQEKIRSHEALPSPLERDGWVFGAPSSVAGGYYNLHYHGRSSNATHVRFLLRKSTQRCAFQNRQPQKLTPIERKSRLSLPSIQVGTQR
jgi:hypothetical protein